MKLTMTTLWACLAERGTPPPTPEFLFHPVRLWRLDWAWPEKKLAVEVNGGLFSRGRHSRGVGQEGDYEKIAEAMILGWRVLVVSPRQIENGMALGWIERLYHSER